MRQTWTVHASVGVCTSLEGSDSVTHIRLNLTEVHAPLGDMLMCEEADRKRNSEREVWCV